MTGDVPSRVPNEAAEAAQAVLGVSALAELAEVVAARVVELLDRQERGSARGLASAAEVAEQLGVHKSWVYAHADELEAIRLGEGEKARLRFDPERVARAVGATPSERGGRRAGRRRHGLPADVRLIEGRGN
jgi:DNA-binding IclR family transcriptional regulator